MDGSSFGRAVVGSIIAMVVIALIVGAVLGLGGYWLLSHLTVGWS